MNFISVGFRFENIKFNLEIPMHFIFVRQSNEIIDIAFKNSILNFQGTNGQFNFIRGENFKYNISFIDSEINVLSKSTSDKLLSIDNKNNISLFRPKI